MPRDGRGQTPGPLAALDALARHLANSILDTIPGGRARRDRRLAANRRKRTEALLEDVVRRAGPSVALSGHSSGPTVDLLIRMAETNHQFRRLWVRTDEEVLVFDLRDGRIARAMADGGDIEGERVGELLVGMGLITPEAIEECLDDAAARQIPLGAALVDRGLVSTEDLREAIRQQSVIRLSRALFAQGAAYAMSDVEGEDLFEDVSINPRELIRASSQSIEPPD